MNVERSTVHPLQVRTVANRLSIEHRGCDELKIVNDDGTRWWLCNRMPGNTDHRIIVESYNPRDGSYAATHIYEDPEPS